MRSRDLRLFEFAPTRSLFDQLLNDTTILMGFECELVTNEYDHETETRDPPDYNRMSWDELSDSLNISERALRRIESQRYEWQANALREAVSELWNDADPDAYTLQW